jgi:hypothetical protein
MKNGLDKSKLTRTNRIVLKKYLKANDLQKTQMRKVLKEQKDNLDLLYELMEINK